MHTNTHQDVFKSNDKMQGYRNCYFQIIIIVSRQGTIVVRIPQHLNKELNPLNNIIFFLNIF